MFSPDDLEKIKGILSEVGFIGKREQEDEPNQDCKNKRNKKNSNSGSTNQTADSSQGCISLNASQLLVVAGILAGVLDVESVLVSRDQSVDIVVTGSLRRRTQLDKIMSQVGQLPFDQVMKSIIDSSM